MKFKVISLFDLKAREYQPPMYVNSIPVAMRDLGDQLTDPNNKSPAAKHPDHFEIRLLADFDSETGSYTKPETPDGGPAFLYSLVDLMPTKQ